MILPLQKARCLGVMWNKGHMVWRTPDTSLDPALLLVKDIHQVPRFDDALVAPSIKMGIKIITWLTEWEKFYNSWHRTAS